MAFIRPAVLEKFKRYEEALWGGAVLLTGLRMSVIGGWFFAILSIPLMIAGAVLIWWGIRRGQFRARHKDGSGTGVVDVTERRLTFFDIGAGASLSLEQVTRIEIETNDLGPKVEDLYWVFYQHGQAPTFIPSGAVGGDEMFDALVAFPGANYDKVIEASQSTQVARFLIWEKSPAPSIDFRS